MEQSLFTTEIRQRVGAIAKKHGLRLVLAFGSAADGAMHEKSDVDIAVLTGENDLSFELYGDVASEFQALFPEHELDLAVINHADPLFLKKIMEAPVLLYGDVRTFNELKIYAYKRYIDHKPYLEMEKRFAVEYPTRHKRAAS